MTFDTVTNYVTAPDENGCEILSSYNDGDTVPFCGCFESTDVPGCYFQFIPASGFTKLVPVGASAVDKGKPDDEDNFCEGKVEKKCRGKCVWTEGATRMVSLAKNLHLKNYTYKLDEQYISR